MEQTTPAGAKSRRTSASGPAQGCARSAVTRSPCARAARRADRRFPPSAAAAAAACLPIERPADTDGPVAFDNAPYLTALVASSCRAMARARPCARAEPGVASLPMQAVLRHVGVGFHRLLDDLAQAGAFPVLARQHVVRARQGDQAALEAGPGLLGARRVAQGLRGDRLHGGEGVLDAVVQLVDQKLLMFLEPLALGDVDEPSRCRSRRPSRAAPTTMRHHARPRRAAERHLDAGPVVAGGAHRPAEAEWFPEVDP